MRYITRTIDCANAGDDRGGDLDRDRLRDRHDDESDGRSRGSSRARITATRRAASGEPATSDPADGPDPVRREEEAEDRPA